MPFRRITGRFWLAAGVPLAHDNTVEAWTYKSGLAAGTLIPVAFAAIYTAFGLSGRRPEAKWWRNQLGTAEVAAALSLIPSFGPLAWTFWKDNGNLTPSWCAWAAVAGPVVTALAWAWLCLIWLRVRATASRDPEENS